MIVNRSTMLPTHGKTPSFASAIPGLLMGILVGGTVCAWFLYTLCVMGNSLWQVHVLKSHGQRAIAHVTGYTPEKRPGGRHRPDIQVHFHTVEFDGHSATVRLPEETPVGTEVRVLFLPEAPEVVTAGERGDSFLTLLHDRAMSWPAWDGMIRATCVVLLVLELAWIGGVEQLERWRRKQFSCSQQAN
jgi:hypothetical protein